MTNNYSIAADLLGSNQALAARYQIPASVMSGAQSSGSYGGAYDVSALLAYISSNNGVISGYPVLNPSPAPAATGWTSTAGEGTLAYNTSPPAGCPLGKCMTFTPNASGSSPLLFVPGVTAVYPGLSYTVSTTLYSSAASGQFGVAQMTIGIGWSNLDDTVLLEEDVFVTPTFNAQTWTPFSIPFTAPSNAGWAFPFVGWTGANVSASNVLSCAGVYLTTPYA